MCKRAADATGSPDKLHWYVRQMQTPWKAVLSVGICLALVAAAIGIGGLTFADQLSISYLPSPALTDVYAAYENFVENNPVFVNGDIEAVLMTRADNGSVFNKSIPELYSARTVGQNLISAINTSVVELSSDAAVPSYRIRWYYTYFDHPELFGLAFQYVFPNDKAMMIGLEFDDAADVSDAFINAVVSAVSSVQKNYTTAETGWTFTATGKTSLLNLIPLL